MRKFNLGNKKILLIIGVIVLLCSGYLGATYYKSSKDSSGPSVEQQKSDKEKINNQNESKVQNEDEKESIIENSKLDYKITNLNKKDGDIFSIPDEVTFTITPTVNKSKITLTSADGVLLYNGETAESEAKFTIYPQKKVMEGSQGTLLIEGFLGSEVVISQKVKVVF